MDPDPDATLPAGGAGRPEGGRDAELHPGSLIGPYKLLELRGEGGFGSVWVAEQSVPVARRVALKFVKLGMGTAEVIARFEAERQALAMMGHPNIAAVYDAGATASGRPYFAMELVNGAPLTTFCDEHAMGTRERLELFSDVCSAVHHAHQKGIIHRDIKPSNVLVAVQGDRPVVKVIDFGIAKATEQRLTDRTLFTAGGQLFGTPVYMSPEQTGLSGLDIDTRSDIYALGVLLYELLTGEPPFNPGELTAAGFDEMRRLIREVDPPRPSGRLAKLPPAELDRRAAKLGQQPSSLLADLKGELDWIVMKAIEKDRRRRYETANALFQDVGHYLGGEAVVARPPSATYRFQKFSRRHRGGLVAAGAVGVALVGGLVASLWQAGVAREARGLAEERLSDLESEQEATQQARAEAEAERARAEEALGFLLDSFRPEDADLTVAQVLERARSELGNSFADRPLTRLALLGALADANEKLGRTDRSLPLREEMHAIAAGALPPRSPAALAHVLDLGRNLNRERRFADADRVLRRAAADLTENRGPGDPATLDFLQELAHNSVTRLDPTGPDPTLAEAAKRDVASARDAFATYLEPDHKHRFWIRATEAQLELLLGNQEEAASIYRELADLVGDGTPGHSQTLDRILLDLSNLYEDSGQFAEAEPLKRRLLARFEDRLGEGHPKTLNVRRELAWLIYYRSRGPESGSLQGVSPEEFEGLLKKNVELAREQVNRRHVLVDALNSLGSCYQTVGEWGGAVVAFREAVETATAIGLREHPGYSGSVLKLAEALTQQARASGDPSGLAEAASLAREHDDILLACPGAAGAAHTHAGLILAKSLRMRGDFEGAAAALDEALRRLRSAGLEVPPDVMEELVWNGIGRRDFTGAARWQARRSEAQPDNTTQAKLLVMLEAATGNHDRQLGLFQRLSAQTAGPAPPVQKADTAVLILASAPPGAPTEVLETATTLAGEASAAGAGFGATLCEALGHLQLGRSDRAAELCLPMTQNQSWPVRAAASAVAARVLAALGQEEDAVRLAAGCRELLDRTPASAERGVYRDWVLDTLLFTELVLRDGGE